MCHDIADVVVESDEFMTRAAMFTMGRVKRFKNAATNDSSYS